jgi:predicted metalloprotease with PDZ domain
VAVDCSAKEFIVTSVKQLYHQGEYQIVTGTIGRAAALIFIATVFLFMVEESSGQGKQLAGNKPKDAQIPEIHYTVSMPKPWTHLLEVELRLKWAHMPHEPELKMPVWTPGSYLVREFARHVQGFRVLNGTGGELSWQKTGKNTWRVNAKGARDITVKYSVYSNELTVRTNELNDEHAFWNNAALLMYPGGQLGTGSKIKVVPYSDWRVATALQPEGAEAHLFRAPNYDILYDSPFEVSDFKEISFDVRGKKHRIVVSGEGNYDLKRLAGDAAKIIDAAISIFGEVDYPDYTFIVNLRGSGGLEHLNSSALQVDRFAFTSETKYKSFLELLAHEYFHVYNVKRIKPDVLGPFDYENENYTRLLWVAEGATVYYARLLLLRSGVINRDEYLNQISASIEQLQNRPGRFETSLEEASFDAWIKYYRQDENAVNNQISYYDKGEIVMMMLDATIRASSNGTKSLDDVMRYLYKEFFKNGKNYTSEDFQKASEMMAGTRLEDFFAKYVSGKADIEYAAILGPVGIDVQAKQENPGKAYLGANLIEENGRLNIRSIPAGTPAYEQGLNARDQIVAVDGHRVTQSFLQTYISDREPGQTIKLSIFRFDILREFEVKLGSDMRMDYNLVPAANASEKQKKLLSEYLGTPK